MDEVLGVSTPEELQVLLVVVQFQIPARFNCFARSAIGDPQIVETSALNLAGGPTLAIESAPAYRRTGGRRAARLGHPGSDLSRPLLNPGVPHPHSRRSTLTLLHSLRRAFGAPRINLILVGIIAVGMLGCQSMSTGGSAPSANGSAGAGSARLQEILDSGKLRIGMTAQQPPFNMTNKAGEIVGLDVDLTSALAESMGLEVEYVLMPFAMLLDALEKKKVDMVASGMTITPARNARVAFAGPYFITGKSVLTKSETLANARETIELDQVERSFAALEDG